MKSLFSILLLLSFSAVAQNPGLNPATTTPASGYHKFVMEGDATGELLFQDMTSSLFLESGSIAANGTGYLAIPSSLVECWTSATNVTTSSCDTGLSRAGAGILAIGNGVAGNASGALQSLRLIGSAGAIYGTLSLGQGSGALIEKTVNDSTPVVLSSENTATTGTGDFYGVKDSGGTVHTVVDHAIGLHGTSIVDSGTLCVSCTTPATGFTAQVYGSLFVGRGVIPTGLAAGEGYGVMSSSGTDNAGFLVNRPSGAQAGSIDLVTGGNLGTGWSMQMDSSNTDWKLLDRAAGAEKIDCASGGACSFNSGVNSFGNINLNGAPATGDNNPSPSLIFTSYFNEGGSTAAAWDVQALIGSGVTPDSTLAITPVAGGTIGQHIISLNSDITQTSTLAATTNVTSPTMNTVNLTVENAGSTGNTQLVRDNTAGGLNIQTLQPLTGNVAVQIGALTTNNGICSASGLLDDCGHDEFAGSAPTITFGSGAGSSPTVGTNLGIRQGGEITITTGNSPVASQPIFTVTFSQPYAHYAFCTLSPSTNTLSDPGGAGVSVVSGYADRFYAYAGPTALTGNSNHTWFYTCSGY